MAHFGIITPPVSGHVNPFGALGRVLQRRGHRVTVIHMEDLRTKVASEELEFHPIGATSHPLGSLPESLKKLGQLDGFAALRFTIKAACKTTQMFCEEGSQAVQKLAIDALLVDQTEPAGACIAEHLRIPYVTICSALVMNRDSMVPPPFSGWRYSKSPIARLRNRVGYAAGNLVTQPILKVIQKFRKIWALPAYQSLEDSFSKNAVISQQPKQFEYPRKDLPSHFYFVGPLRAPVKAPVLFPWEELTGAPIIYGSLGSLQGSKADIFKIMAEACRSLPVQLVLSHGNSLPEAMVQALGQKCLIVPYAPQIELLARTKLTLTHGGLNTVLDSLSQGVPLIAIPITYEQPAIAERVRWAGVGEVIPLERLTAPRLQHVIQRVLGTEAYFNNAKMLAHDIQSAGGATKAATLCEDTLLRCNND